MMELLDSRSNPLNTARQALGRCWYTNSSFSFWWELIHQLNSAATEEYDGTTWATSPGSLNFSKKWLI
jgi:hypothetical protein